jgi:hypothetical protein
MRVVQTHNKRVVFGILLSALIVGVILTIGRVPLAVSQPVTIPAKMVKGAIPMDGANPVWEGVPGVIVPLSGQLITTPMHPNISVKSVFVKAMTNGKELGLSPGLPGSGGGHVPSQHGWSATLPVHGSVRRHHQHLAVERRVAEGPRQG